MNPFIEKLKRKRAVKLIRTGDDPILSQVCDPVAEGEDLEDLLSLMFSALGGSPDGVGLAAPQVGINKRVVIIAEPGKEKIVMVNPQIVSRSTATKIESEGCLSYPGIFTPVERNVQIEVLFNDASGSFEMGLYSQTFKGFESRIVQHEIDHLDGICKVGDAFKRNNRKLNLHVARAVVAAMSMGVTH